MAQEDEVFAWLETERAKRILVTGLCTFGRVPGNTVVLNTPKASRRHAMIHEQDGEFWIVDLGSTNGVQVNGERLTHPVRLQSGDLIKMPDSSFKFQSAAQPWTAGESRRSSPLKELNRRTVADVRMVKCWILLADIQGFTTISQKVPPEELAPLVGKWLAHCQEIVQGQQGVLAKFLGDGFLAYWTDRNDVTASIASACRLFQELQKSASLPFRIILHHGLVSFGGHSPDASHTMIGRELNFAFRLEKVASKMDLSWIISDVAAKLLEPHLPIESCGQQKVPDFAEKQLCFTLAAPPGDPRNR
jgi:adenylate cyclase